MYDFISFNLFNTIVSESPPQIAAPKTIVPNLCRFHFIFILIENYTNNVI